MQAMKLGEQGFFYHSNEGKAIVGIVEVCKAYRPDPTDATGKFGMVDIRAVRPLAASGPARGREGGETPRGNGAGHQFAPVGPAGDGPGMGADLRDGRAVRAFPPSPRSGEGGRRPDGVRKAGLLR